MAERRARLARDGLRGGNPRHHVDRHVREPLVAGGRLEHHRRHGEHARVARRDHGHPAAPQRQVERELGPLRLFGVVAAVTDEVRSVGEKIEIERLEDHASLYSILVPSRKVGQLAQV